MMQVSVRNSVHLLQVKYISLCPIKSSANISFLADISYPRPEDVPPSLKALLLSERVMKVGYHVQGNLDLQEFGPMHSDPLQTRRGLD
jgi:hypothetical protein